MSVKYEFTIVTGDEAGAGTDSNIFVILDGERGQTDEVRLNGHISGNAFERNQTDTFMVPFAEDVGDIYRVTLRSDQRYSASAWLLNRLSVRFVLDSQHKRFRTASVFRVARWITDERAHELRGPDGYHSDVTMGEEWVVVDGAPQFIPDNPSSSQVQEQKISVRMSAKTSLVYATEAVTSISTKLALSQKFPAFQAALESEFKRTVTERAQITLETELSFQNDYVIRVGPGERGGQLIEKWAERRKHLEIRLGDSALPDVHALVEKRFVGLADRSTGVLVMQVDAGVPVSLPASPHQLAWSMGT